MKKYLIIFGLIFISMVFLPLFSALGAVKPTQAIIKDIQTTENNLTEANEAKSVALLNVSDNKVREIELEEYVLGCVSAEMPYSYEQEALKAQAVACRTYAKYCMQNPYSDKADITTDSSVHQAFCTQDALKEKWGENYDKYIKTVKKAVKATKGEYITYNGEIIKPTYFALSSGKTTSAEDVWGNDVPYLQSETSDGDKLSPSLISSFTFSKEELSEKLSAFFGEEITQISIGESVKATNGYVKSIDISGKSFSGEELRSALVLRSGCFKIKKSGDFYIFTCEGFGHTVGMSQYGANVMAKEGSTYKEILSHYYRDTSVNT